MNGSTPEFCILELPGSNLCVPGLRIAGDQLLQFLQSHPGWRVPNLAEALQKSRPTIERHLRELRNAGKIEFRGAPKNGGYFSK